MSEYVSFLVRNLSPSLLKRMRKEAEKERRSLSDLMRAILCEHYGLDCAPSGAPTRIKLGAQTQHLKIHPHLKRAIEEESKETGISEQRLVHEALEAHYKEVTA